MEETLINDYARGLMDAHGDRAIAEAAQRAAHMRTPGRQGRGEDLAPGRSGPEDDAGPDRELNAASLAAGSGRRVFPGLSAPGRPLSNGALLFDIYYMEHMFI